MGHDRDLEYSIHVVDDHILNLLTNDYDMKKIKAGTFVKMIHIADDLISSIKHACKWLWHEKALYRYFAQSVKLEC